ncbi:MAG: hypothetical protein KDD89_09870 [Anaerolineales bacterium]|nr:hypothetical protein [Anaerolineales bacterium]
MPLFLLLITAVLLLASGLFIFIVMPTLTSGYFLLLGGVGLLLACVVLWFMRGQNETAVGGDDIY